jgi:hypothetical protein
MRLANVATSHKPGERFMMPIPLFRCPETVKPSQAEHMAKICDLEYRAATKRENKIKSGAPVVCVSTSGIHGYWSLECNDPDLERTTIDKIVQNIRKWEHAPASPNAE